MRTIPLGILGIRSSLVKSKYLKNKKLFLNFLFHLGNLHEFLNIFEKKMIAIGNVSQKLQTVKDFVKKLPGKCRFRISFDNENGTWWQTLLKSAWEHFYHIFGSLWSKMTLKISPLLKFEILGSFVNTFTADDKYPAWDCENLKFPIQLQLS